MYIHRPALGEVWLNNLDNASFALRAKKFHISEIFKKKTIALSESEDANER